MAAASAQTKKDDAGAPLLTEAQQAPAQPQQESGLTTAEAEQILARDGYNELKEEEARPCLKFLSYFWGPMPIMIWLAIFVELAEAFEPDGSEHWVDFSVLMLLQFINGIVGWYEERNAGNAIAALMEKLALTANVLRDGQWVVLPARELAAGDVVHIKLGDIIPADCNLLPDSSGLPIQVDQSSLNGESLPATKYAGDGCYQGTIVKRGEIDALVTETGTRTFFGKASELVAKAGENKAGGHFQKLIVQLTLGLLCFSLTLVIILMIKLLLGGESFLKVIAIAVVLLVASIPIAMQVVCTSTMAVGAHRLALRQALVCKLTAIEELATMNILCSDKTGTLTMNQIAVQSPCFMAPHGRCTREEELIFVAALAAHRGGSEQDAIDKCICNEIIEKRNLKEALDSFKTLHFVPFDPVTKRTEAIVEASGQKGMDMVPPEWRGAPMRVMKGAPQVILAMSSNCDSIKDVVTAEVNTLAGKGFRCLGIARAAHQKAPEDSGSSEGDMPIKWEFMGLIPLADPPRHDTLATIQKAQALGVEIKMITGDQGAIAKQTSLDLDMGTVIHTADALQLPPGIETTNVNMAAHLGELVEGANGFAEVFPEHKFQIVQILQQRGHRVGMTGDGVNDAPALRAADVGIAVDGSTDAARAAADIVLTSPGLSVIIEAIARARMIFERMRNYCIYRISCTMNILIFLWVAMMFIPLEGYTKPGQVTDKTFRLPVLCLVLIMLLNDGCILTIAYDKVNPSSKPCNWNLGQVIIIAGMCGAVACSATLLLLIAGLNALDGEGDFYHNYWKQIGLPILNYPQLQTMMYLAVSLMGFLTLFAARTRSFFFTRMIGTPLAFATVFALGASTVLSVTNFIKAVSAETLDSALPGGVIGMVWIYCIVAFLIQDVAKVALIKYLDRNLSEEDVQVNAGLLRSSFWMVRSTMSVSPNAPSTSRSHTGESLLAAARSVRLSQTDSQIIHQLERQVTHSGAGNSIISKGSMLSASVTADPLANVNKEMGSSVGDRSTNAGGSALESARPSSSLWGTQARPSAFSGGRPSSSSAAAAAAASSASQSSSA